MPIGVPIFWTGARGVVDVTVHQRTQLFTPADCLVELHEDAVEQLGPAILDSDYATKKRDGQAQPRVEWRELRTPVTLEAGQRVRIRPR